MREGIAALSFTCCIFETLRDRMIVGIEKRVLKCFWREIAGVKFIAVSHGVELLSPLVISFLDTVVGNIIMQISLIVLSEIHRVELSADRGLLHDDGILPIQRGLI